MSMTMLGLCCCCAVAGATATITAEDHANKAIPIVLIKLMICFLTVCFFVTA